MKKRTLIILAFVLVVASAIISAMFYSKTELRGWDILLNGESSISLGIGTYKGKMSEEDCKVIWNTWDKYEHKDGFAVGNPDVCFFISDDENHTEFFAYNKKDGLLQYYLVDYNDYHHRYKNIYTFVYLSEEDQDIVHAMIEKYRSELVKWTLEVGDSKYELTSTSIKAFSALWNSAYGSKEVEKSDELFKEKTKDTDALFTITLHNCWEGESYFTFKDKTLTFVTIQHNAKTGEYHEYHRRVVLKSESLLATMWTIIEGYTGYVSGWRWC